MADFEQELRESLRRVDAPRGFADRVVARAEMRQRRGADHRVWWRAVAAAFLLGALSGGWVVHREHVDRRQAMETKEQFDTAMRVTTRVTQRSFTEAQRRINRDPETEGQQGEAR